MNFSKSQWTVTINASILTTRKTKVDYVDSCPNQPVHSKAFCDIHCQEAMASNIPTDLREYVAFCRKLVAYICITDNQCR